MALLSLCACGKQATEAGTQEPTTPKGADSFSAELDKAAIDGYCSQPAEAYIEFLRKGLDYIDTVLPNVTPEESAYLRRENDAITKLYQQEETAKTSHGPSNSRMAQLSARRLYYVWSARKELANALTSVDGVYDPEKVNKARTEGSTNVQATTNAFRRGKSDTLLRMMETVYYLGGAEGALREFLVHEQYRRDGLVSNEQYPQFYSAVIALPLWVKQAMQCQLAHVVVDPRENPAAWP